MMTREKAREWLLDHMPCKAIMPTAYSAYQNAVAALYVPTREMMEMMRGCADCQRKTCVSCRRFGWMPQQCLDCNDQNKWSPWNFCPVCGKPLTDKAVDMAMERIKKMEEIRNELG